MIVVGAGLAGLAAAAEARGGRARACCCSTRSLSSRSAARPGGRSAGCSSWTRRSSAGCGSATDLDLAWQDWLGTAGFDRPEDELPRQWARAYVEFAAGEKRSWLRQMGHSVIPVVGWAERGGYLATGHGNSVPRFHITWGTGPGVVEPFERRVRAAAETGRLEFRFRHRVDELDR